MRKKPPKTFTLRNGMKWRDGRPRWEPSPASRAIGVKGVDLRRPDGAWMARGEAIDVADGRQLWASKLRAAAAGGVAGAAALEDLAAVLDGLAAPADAAGLARRELLADLVDHARRLLGEQAKAAGRPPPRRERTVARLVEAYLAATDVKISASTREAYGVQSKRLIAKFGQARVGEVTRGALIAWYAELRKEISISNANQCLGATAAFFAWSTRQDPPWIAVSPVTQLGLEHAPGRRVFWTMEDEQAFVGWADANGWADLADGVVACLWTGARIGDVCAANLGQLAGDVWRFMPQKTIRKKQEAMPAIMAPVKARIARRRAQAVAAIDDAFLFDPRTGRRYTADDFGRRYADARAWFIASDQAPAGFIDKRVQDTRDTCITRLWEADVKLDRMWAWTGHSQKSIERILREHYLVLREAGTMAMADQLATWARAQGVGL